MSDHYYRIILAMVAAAILACVLTIFTATADTVEAGVKLDNFDAFGSQIGSACSQQAWPYYEAHCLRDLRPGVSLRRSYRAVLIDQYE